MCSDNHAFAQHVLISFGRIRPTRFLLQSFRGGAGGAFPCCHRGGRHHTFSGQTKTHFLKKAGVGNEGHKSGSTCNDFNKGGPKTGPLFWSPKDRNYRIPGQEKTESRDRKNGTPRPRKNEPGDGNKKQTPRPKKHYRGTNKFGPSSSIIQHHPSSSIILYHHRS